MSYCLKLMFDTVYLLLSFVFFVLELLNNIFKLFALLPSTLYPFFKNKILSFLFLFELFLDDVANFKLKVINLIELFLSFLEIGHFFT